MKKILASILLAGSLLIPVVSLAAPQTDTTCKAYVNEGIASLFPTHFCDVGEATRAIVNVLLGLISLAAVIFIILGGYKYVTSQGNNEAATAGRKTMTNAVIGLVIAVLAYTVVAVVSNTISSVGPAGNGGGGTGTNPNTQANENLKRSFFPSTSDTLSPFFVRINASLADLKVICPTTDPDPTVRATGDVKVTYPDGSKEAFVLSSQNMSVSGDSVTGVIQAASHANAGINDEDTVLVGITYFVGNCAARAEQSFAGNAVLGH